MKYTFGGTRAAQRLETLVENNPTARRKISALLSNYSRTLLLIVRVHDASTVRFCWQMLRDYTLNRLDKKTGLTEEMKTYTKNVIIYRYRVYLKEFNDLINRIKQQGLTSGKKGV